MRVQGAPRPARAVRQIRKTNMEFGPRLEFYGEIPEPTFWDTMWSDNVDPWKRAARGHLPVQIRSAVRRWVPPMGRILEAGCGLAAFTVAMDQRGYLAEGVDFAPFTVERLQERFPGIHFWLGDVRKLDVADGTYDAVYSPGVCEHFQEGPEAVLAETRRVLKPGGIALVRAPCYSEWWQRHGRSFDGSEVEPKGSFFQYAFTVYEMTERLRLAGFDVIETRQFGTFALLRSEYFGFVPELGKLDSLAGAALDILPTRKWGKGCLWVARRC